MEDTTIMKDFREVKAGKTGFKKDYITIMLWFVGRAIQAAAAMDETVKKEFAELPDRFTFSLGIMPAGPYMIVWKSKRGIVYYLGWDPEGKDIMLEMKIKNIEAAMLLFTFQESTAVAIARDRLIVDGEVPHACAVIRILDIVEVYLLPKFIAKLAVKRYPAEHHGNKFSRRVMFYIRTVLGV
jgi:hypothetical protein